MNFQKTTAADTFLRNGGEMSRLTLAYNWAETPLGPIDTWPPSLKTMVSVILNSRFPMFLWWGEDLIQLYNDAYRPSLGNNGKHPTALGQKGKDCWPEIWNDIKPLIDSVLQEGKSTWSEDQLLPIYRNGKMEDVYWTYSYSPVYDEYNDIKGVLVVCSETTEKVKALEKITRSEYFNRQLVNNSVAAQCVFLGEEMVVSVANDYMLNIWGADGSAIGKPFMEILPELRSTSVYERMLNVYRTGEHYFQPEEMFTLNLYGKPYIGYYTYSYQALRDAAGNIYGIVSTALDITHSVLDRRKIEKAEEHTLLAIESAELGTYELDMQTDVINVSARFKKIWGFQENMEFSRNDFAAAIHPDDADMRIKAHEEAIKNGHLFYESRIYWPDGSIHWVRVNGKVIYSESHEPNFLLGVTKDITAEKEIERHKDDFVSVVSHELRTPVTSLKGYTDLLAEKFNSEHESEAALMIGRSQALVKRIHLIIQDMLDVAKLGEGKLILRKEIFDINVLLRQVTDETAHVYNKRTVIFNNSSATMVCADKERISQVITNLLSNALKYSPENKEVIVNSKIENGEVICSFTDLGRGIAESDQVKIFERFYQVSGHNRDSVGLGLGLYICSVIMKKQNGRIWLESEIGKGSVFYFSLPVEYDHVPDIA